MSKKNIIEKLNDLQLHHNVTQADWEESQRQVKEILAQKALRDKASKEMQRITEIENNKPENAIPRMWRVKHVKENANELYAYCQTYPLEPLENYADELAKGQHKADFRGESPLEALLFLRECLNARKPTDPNATRLQYYKETKTELEENRKNIKKAQEQLKDTQNALAEVKAKLTGDNPEKAKEYTT
jgi:hypothetical protein